MFFSFLLSGWAGGGGRGEQGVADGSLHHRSSNVKWHRSNGEKGMGGDRTGH